MKEVGKFSLVRKVRAIGSVLLDHSFEAQVRRQEAQDAINWGAELWRGVQEDFKSGKDTGTMEEIDAALDVEVLKLEEKPTFR